VTKAVPFTQAAVRRAIEGARAAGIEVGAVSVHADGTITVHKLGATVDPAPTAPHADSPEPWRFQA
jgi:hypothetical protein